MYNDQFDLKEILNTQYNQIRKIDKQNDRILYNVTKSKLTRTAWMLLSYNYGENRITEFGLEVIETLDNCLKNFSINKNVVFSNYFLSSFSKNIKRIEFTRYIENTRSGITSHGKIEQMFRRFEKLEININNEKVLIQIANFCRSDLDTVKSALQIYINPVKSQEIKNNNNEIYSIVENYPDKNNEFFRLPYYELKNLEKELSIVETVFENSQDRTKVYLSKLLTLNLIQNLYELYAKILDIENPQITPDEIEKQSDLFFSKYNFIDLRLLHEFLLKKELPTQQDIANEFGKDKTDASRTLKNFKTKVKKIKMN